MKMRTRKQIKQKLDEQKGALKLNTKLIQEKQDIASQLQVPERLEALDAVYAMRGVTTRIKHTISILEWVLDDKKEL